MAATAKVVPLRKKDALLTGAVDSLIVAARGMKGAAEAIAVLFKGVRVANRKSTAKALYAAVIARAGDDPATGEPFKTEALKSADPEVYAAYVLARKYVSLALKAPGAPVKKKGGVVIAPPMTLAAARKMAKVAIDALKGAEAAPYNILRVVAAWEALVEAYEPLPKKK